MKQLLFSDPNIAKTVKKLIDKILDVALNAICLLSIICFFGTLILIVWYDGEYKYVLNSVLYTCVIVFIASLIVWGFLFYKSDKAN